MAVITALSQLNFTKTYTYADYMSWQFEEYVELVRGRVMPKPTPFTAHQQCLGNLTGMIRLFCKRKPYQAWMGPFDVRLGGEVEDDRIATVVQPDLFIVLDPGKIDERGCLGTPDWIVEVVSPRTISRDTKTKFDLYAENGVGEYWIVYPGEQTISVYVLQDGEYQPQADYYEPGLIPSYTLPELQLEWADVFEGVE